jgi:hypothetical protein
MRRAAILLACLLALAPLGAGARAARPVPAATITRVLTIPSVGLARVHLRPVNLLAPGARVTEGLRPITLGAKTYEGTVAGDPASIVRLTIGRDWTSGVIRTRGAWYSVDPDSWAEPSRTLVQRVLPSELAGIAMHGDTVASQAEEPVPQAGIGVGNCIVFDCNRLSTVIALDGDVAFRNLAPSTCADRLLSVFNSVKAIFDDNPTKIDLAASHINCHTAADFGGSGTHPLTFLENMRDYWNDRVDIDRSSVVLLSGYVFPEGSPIGLAYEPGVCTRIVAPVVTGTVPQSCSLGYALMQAVAKSNSNYTASAFLKAKLFAHELGHNFDAAHDTGPECKGADVSPRTGPIMCPVLQEAGPQSFSSASASAIRGHAERTIGSATGS